MFGWFKKKVPPSPDDQARAVVQAAIDAAMKFGGILEDNPGLLVMDTAMLPLSKPEMKVALRIAWKTAGSPELRDAVEACYLGLSNFQEGVGPKSIDLNVSVTDDAATTAKKLAANMPWMNKTMDEMRHLKIELDAFKRDEGAAWLSRAH